jgi:mRNA-degrading endonuclease RelE of RelBE toxin-antitoxin system
MISHTTERFRKLYENLPKQIREQANQAYSQFKSDPYHPGLHFKRIHSSRPIYSVRITKDYRAVGVQQDNEIIWFWIGSHSDYDKLLNQLRHA